MNKSEQPRRQSYLVHPQFQVRLIVFLLVMAFAVMGIFTFSYLYLFDQLQSLGPILALPSGHPYYQFVADKRVTLFALVAWTGASVVVLLVLSGIIFSHWAAGPIRKLERAMQDLNGRFERGQRDFDAAADLMHIRFRRYDFFSELSREYNRLLENIRKLKS